MKTLKEKIEVMRAALDGKEIEICIDAHRVSKKNHKWRPIDDGLAFNWEYNDYRIKPEPMEFWINVYADAIYGDAHETKQEAEVAAYNCKSLKLRTIKVREVIE